MRPLCKIFELLKSDGVSHANTKAVELKYMLVLYTSMSILKRLRIIDGWALYAYFSDSQNAAFELLVWRMNYQRNR